MSNDAVAQTETTGAGKQPALDMGADSITPEMYRKIDAIVERYKDKPGSLIPVLQQAQEVCGYLPHVVQRYIAQGMKMSPSMVFGVATFYSYFTLVPRGKHVIRVCLGTACYVRGSQEVLDKAQKELGIKVGGTTEDRRYSLDVVRCIGACGLAPAMLVNEDVYGRVKSPHLVDILKKYE